MEKGKEMAGRTEHKPEHSDRDAGTNRRRPAGALGLPAKSIPAMLDLQRAVTRDGWLLLAPFFDTTPEFWFHSMKRSKTSARAGDNAGEGASRKTTPSVLR